MKRIIFFLLAAICCGLTSCDNDEKQELGSEVEPEKTVMVTDNRKSIDSEVMQIPYHEIVVSSVLNDEKPCLVIYLHGGTSTGVDNEKQLGEAGIDSISNYLIAHQKNAIFLVPQCPNHQYWIGPAKIVLGELINQYLTAGKVDDKQIYLFGGSMAYDKVLEYVRE